MLVSLHKPYEVLYQTNAINHNAWVFPIESDNLRKSYEDTFHICRDVSYDPHLLAASFRLRYQVYCVEYDYEDPDEFPNHKEIDLYDERSLHTLLIHRSTDFVAGAVRLIRPDRRRPQDSLPIDLLCREPVLHDEIELPRIGLAEISRFAVSKEFRQRMEDAPNSSGIGPDWRERKHRRRRLPHLSIGLMQGLVCNSRRHGIVDWVAEMEPALLRMLKKLGIHFTNMGPVVHFHGRRQPCYAHIDELLMRVKQERPDVWGLITKDGECY